ncbi:MAG: non-canonical purine NTP diphosphatase [Candidatus Cyclobacteriaceae bacterium M3_2C_046]
MKICFATNNLHKLKEIQALLGAQFKVLSLAQIGCREDLPETHNTLEGNSLQKAQYVFQNFHLDCFADDTGLEVNALSGAPGVRSARYAGDQKDNEANKQLLLQHLQNHSDKRARFRTVITLILNGEVHQFEGIVNGKIIDQLRGNQGFGYDPLFVPDGYNRTFAEMTLDEKGKISHRGIAVRKLVEFLNNLPDSM